MIRFTFQNMTEDALHYDRLVEAALKGVVRSALAIVANDGLPGNHHFYITFDTRDEDVVIPPYLREKYPEEMTIVLQYQFSNLRVDKDCFSVALSFNNVLEHLTVPFDAVTGFADPSVKFGLQFHHHVFTGDEIEEAFEALQREEESLPLVPEEAAPPAAPKGKGGKGAGNVVSLDKFRNKKK
jgi:hypothetical protein